MEHTYTHLIAEEPNSNRPQSRVLLGQRRGGEGEHRLENDIHQIAAVVVQNPMGVRGAGVCGFCGERCMNVMCCEVRIA